MLAYYCPISLETYFPTLYMMTYIQPAVSYDKIYTGGEPTDLPTLPDTIRPT